MLAKLKKINFEKVLFALEILFYLFCFTKMCLNLCYGTESMHQTFRDYYNYKAIAYFLGVLLVVRRIKILHPVPIIYIIGYIIGAVFYFKKGQFELELYNANMSKCIAFGLFFLLIIDFIVARNLVKWKERNKILTIIYVIAFVLAAILSPGRGALIYLICPFAAFYFIRISEKKWNTLIYCLSAAMWISLVIVMSKSLIEVPYEGERYWGVFLNLSTIGAFCAGASTCAVFWFFLIKGNDIKANIYRILAVVAFAITTYFVMLISARGSQLALILVVLTGFIFWFGKHDIKKIKKRFYIGGGVLIVGISIFILMLWGLYNIDIDSVKDLVKNDILYGQIAYWHNRAKTTFDAQSITFEHGTLLAMLDRFSSGRLGIWMHYMEEMTLLGHQGVHLPVIEAVHPHNNYIAWLYQYGIIGGSAVLVWFVYLNVCIFKKAYKEGAKKYLFPFLWCVFATSAMLIETILWIYLPAFVLLFVQYIAMVNITDEENKGV